jgi:hypothetical protein
VISAGWLAVSLALAIAIRLCVEMAWVPKAFEIDMSRLLVTALALGILGTLLLVPVCLLRGTIQLVQGRLPAAAATGFLCLAALATFFLIAWVVREFFVV